MDPVSVIALTGSVTGILDVLARSLTGLSGIITRYNNAALYMKLVASQLSLQRSALNQLLEWIRFTPSSLERNPVILGDLQTAISTCELLIWTLDSETQQLHGGDQKNPKSYHKLLIAFDTMCKERQMQLTHQVTAPNFLLNAINCRSGVEQEQNLQSASHRQAMSDVEDDSVSLRVSLGPNDSIIISVHSSKGSSLSGLVLDLGSDVMSTRGIQAPSQQRLPDATPPLLDSEKSADKNKQASSSPNANEVSGLANLFQGRLGKLLTPRYGRPSLAPLRGIVRHRPALLPVLKTSQDVVATQETRKLEDPNTTRVMLFGAACSGKTSLMRSVELFCTGELRNAPGWFDLWVRRESAAERMINILDFMEVESVPFGVAESEKYLKSLVYNRTELMDAKSQREVCAAIAHLWKDEGVRNAFRRMTQESYASKDSPYLFDNVDRFTSEHRVMNGDIMKHYIRTTGITQRSFEYQNSRISIYDHAGARSERKKWIHSFDIIGILVLAMDITCWNRPLYEDHSGDKMRKSYGLFEALFNSRWFKGLAKILVFTNANALRAKLASDPLERFEEKYRGYDDPRLAQEYLENKFLSLYRMEDGQPVSVLFTDFSLGLTQPAEQLLNEVQRLRGLESRPD